jgi:hypothetical protein
VAYPPGYPLPPGAAVQTGSPTRLQAGGSAAAAAAAGGQLPDLARLAPSQLATLLSDEEEYKSVLRGVVAGSQMAAALEDIRVKNRQLAASNLSQQGAIAEARNQLAVVRSSEYQVGAWGAHISNGGHPRRQACCFAGRPCGRAREPRPRLCSQPAGAPRPAHKRARAQDPPPDPGSTPSFKHPPQAIRARFDELLARQAKVSKVLGGPLFRERLEDAVCEADSASGALGAAFLAGQLPLEQFLEQYVEARAQHHALDLKRQAAEAVL